MLVPGFGKMEGPRFFTFGGGRGAGDCPLPHLEARLWRLKQNLWSKPCRHWMVHCGVTETDRNHLFSAQLCSWKPATRILAGNWPSTQQNENFLQNLVQLVFSLYFVAVTCTKTTHRSITLRCRGTHLCERKGSDPPFKFHATSVNIVWLRKGTQACMGFFGNRGQPLV